MTVGNPNTMVKDRQFLWKHFRNNKFERPFYHGVVGPQFQIPLAEDNKGFNHISSPMPVPEMVRRIQATDLPPVTYSQTSFDMPLRKDVIQASIPSATIRTVEENTDPRNPPKKPVHHVSHTLYHGTGSTSPEINPSFIQKKSKKHHKKNKNHKKDFNVVHERNEAMTQARNAEGRVTNILNSVTGSPNGGSTMVLGVDLVNKYSQPQLRIHEHNAALIKRIHDLRGTPAGVRSAHTFRKLPPSIL